MTSRARDKAGSGPAVQKTAVFSVAVLLLVMGGGLAFAAGAADSSRASAPAVIVSDRPVQRVPSAIASATVGVATLGSAKPTRPESDSDQNSKPAAASPSSAQRKPRAQSSAAKKRRDDDERETVAPPVRDDDDAEDDGDDRETVVPPVRDDDEDHESD